MSTQFFYVENAALANYQTAAALNASANSYGGVNTSEVYLQPSAAVNGSGFTVNGSGSGGGTTGTGTTEPGNGGSTGGGEQPVTVAAPTFYGETQFTDTTQVTMTAESGAQIHYTLDGSTPTASSTLYSSAITLSDTTTVKAIAIKDGVSSTVTSRTYSKVESGGGEGGGSGFNS